MSAPLIAVIDYGLGNVRNMVNALNKVGAQPILTNSKKKILSADALVLPGVGAFSHGMKQLKEHALIDVIHKFASTNKPFLGVCLGMQMMFDKSDEFGETKGLGLIAGDIKIINIDSTKRQRLPHVGWNNIIVPDNALSWEGTILSGIQNNADMYFIHSYAASPILQDVLLAVTQYHDYIFCSAVKNGNIYGVQFHPEKSATSGLLVLKNLISLA